MANIKHNTMTKRSNPLDTDTRKEMANYYDELRQALLTSDENYAEIDAGEWGLFSARQGNQGMRIYLGTRDGQMRHLTTHKSYRSMDRTLYQMAKG